MISVYKREMKSYFSTVVGYISIALMIAVTGIFVRLYCFTGGYPKFEAVLPNSAIVLMLAVPLITMRTFAEERRQKTDLLLYSLPLTTGQIVAGKYLATVTVLAIPCGLMGLIPIILSFYGTVNLGSAYAGLLAYFLLSCAMAAICMFMSALTESQVIAAVLGIGTLFLIYISSMISSAVPITAIASFIALTVAVLLLGVVVYLLTKDYWIAFTVAVVIEAVLVIIYITNGSVYTGLFQNVVGEASLFVRLGDFVTNELFDMTTIVYYGSVAALFCYLTGVVFEKRRYN